MKKIININLSGRVIPIEDSAYERLQAYIESLRRYFAKEEGRDEIINDIESRIAELMNDKIRKGAACITDADVEEIMASMGRPEDFDEAAEETTSTASGASANSQQQQQQDSYERKKTNRLYRDTSDKVIGGVCSGIAAYLNVDPAIIRILFAIITFGGFGLGFLIYIIMWMILPTKDLEGFSGKRLYRNPDDRVIAGVAGGLAAYFNKDVKIIRLILAAPIILNIIAGMFNGFAWGHGFDLFPNIFFGSLTSTFCIIYVVLWMILPVARNNYEKMEMRGEKVDLNSIRQNVQGEMDNMKQRMQSWGNEVKESAENLSSKAKEFANTRGKTFATEFGETARRGGQGIGHVIGVIFKAFFLFIAGTIAFGLFVALMALVFGGAAWWPINNFIWTSKSQQFYAWGTLIFFLLVPLVGLIIWVIRRIIGTRSRNGYLGWIFGVLWTIGWVSVVLFASSVTRDFSSYESSAGNPVQISQPANGKMIMVVSQPELEYTGSFGWMNDGGEGWDMSADTLRFSFVKFNVVKSPDSLYHVYTRGWSYGRTENDARARAAKLEYTIHSQDSVLDLANGYAVDRESKFRGQQVEIEIQVPAGKKFRFDETVREKLHPANFTVRKSRRRDRVAGIRYDEDFSFRFRSNVDYTMGIDGNAIEEGGRVIKDNRSNSTDGKYRYNADEKPAYRYKDSSGTKKDTGTEKEKPANRVAESMDDRDDMNSSSPSAPLLSLVTLF